jgi:hypothetical protein
MPLAILTFDEGLDTISGGSCGEGKTFNILARKNSDLQSTFTLTYICKC